VTTGASPVYFERDRSLAGRAHVLRTSRRAWERGYVRAVAALDALSALFAGTTAFLLGHADRFRGTYSLWYLAASAALPLVWVSSMSASRAYEARFLAIGAEEFRRVLSASMAVIAVVATLSLAIDAEMGRRYIAVTLPMATLLTLLSRYLARKIVHRRRRRGLCMSDVLLVGHGRSVAELVRQVRREVHHGMRVVGVCVPDGCLSEDVAGLGVPVHGTFADVEEALSRTGADTVAVLACPEMDGTELRRLAWTLAGHGVDLVVAPALMEVAGPRIAIRPVCGLPLLHVDEPYLSGGRRVAKEVVDRSLALVGLVLLSPLLLGIAVAIRLTSPGGAIFRQTRVGLDGRPFTMWKFRTMIQSAVEQRPALNGANRHSTGHLFKMSADPRVTPVGRWLRRTSLDELPQLVNILLGQMSLVGPRPLPASDEPYDGEARRRLYVKPGLTGLWQISGRSDLDWEESVRLDLRYVEQWSLALDALIIWKTVFAVLKGRGAY
jgi:exopolysaccharide biosynthesis polyprenyl glycosylphosphotransferase